MIRKGSSKSIDLVTLSIYLLLVFMGLLNIYSASYKPEHPQLFDMSQEYGKQLMWIGLSILVGFICLKIDAGFFRNFSWIIYGATLVLLVVVLGTPKINGARSWLGIGGFGIQPSEFAKIGTAIALSRFIYAPHEISGFFSAYISIITNVLNAVLRILTLQFIIRWEIQLKTQQISAAHIILVPSMLIMLQPDAGTFLVFLSFSFVLYREGLSGNVLLVGFYVVTLAVLSLLMKDSTFMFPVLEDELSGVWNVVFVLALVCVIAALLMRSFVARRDRKQGLVILLLGFLFSTGIVFGIRHTFENVLKIHQRNRIELFLGLYEDPDGIDYNRNRAMAAIGSGGFMGKGYHQATLANAKQRHVPMQSTDFIFCTLAEEWGFTGSFIVIILFMALLVRIIMIAERQRSSFTRVFAYCIACIFFFHFFINVGMTIGLTPVIGIPLPFFSYGGSSLLSFTLMIFVLLRLDQERMEMLR